MGQLIALPKQMTPFALTALPSPAGQISKFVLTATPWNSDEPSIFRGFVHVEDLLEELADLGTDEESREAVRRSLLAGAACTLPRVWLDPPRAEALKAAGRTTNYASQRRQPLVLPLATSFARSAQRR